MSFQQTSDEAVRKAKGKAAAKASRREVMYEVPDSSRTPSPPNPDSTISRALAASELSDSNSGALVPDEDDDDGDDGVVQQGQHLIGDIARIVSGQHATSARVQQELLTTRERLSAVEQRLQVQAHEQTRQTSLIVAFQQQQQEAAQQQQTMFATLFAKLGISLSAVPTPQVPATSSIVAPSLVQLVPTLVVSSDNGQAANSASGSRSSSVPDNFELADLSFQEPVNDNAPSITASDERFGKAYGKMAATELVSAIGTLKDKVESSANGASDGFVEDQQSPEALYAAHAAEAKLKFDTTFVARDTEDAVSVSTSFTRGHQEYFPPLTITASVAAERWMIFKELFKVLKDTPRMPVDSPTFGTGLKTDVDDSVPLLRGLRHKMFGCALSHDEHGARIILASMGTDSGNRFRQKLERWVLDGKGTTWSDMCDLTLETFPPSMSTWVARDKLREL
ncbi:hypothetical protein H4R27_006549, partial [Coemansia aciculifera]